MATSLRSRTTVKSLAKDALDVGTLSFGTVLTTDPGWGVIRPEDMLVKKKLKAKVQKAINKAVEAILEGEESTQEDEDSNQEEVNVRNHGASNQLDYLALRLSLETDHGTCSRSSNLPLETQQTDATRPSKRQSSSFTTRTPISTLTRTTPAPIQAMSYQLLHAKPSAIRMCPLLNLCPDAPSRTRSSKHLLNLQPDEGASKTCCSHSTPSI